MTAWIPHARRTFRAFGETMHGRRGGDNASAIVVTSGDHLENNICLQDLMFLMAMRIQENQEIMGWLPAAARTHSRCRLLFSCSLTTISSTFHQRLPEVLCAGCFVQRGHQAYPPFASCVCRTG
ncbi:uncharacterized protein LOC119572095 [Penaeus monodon]|uniref:uncharacterized protein LOC119572095 n=1 Tax=Penaeus monodon TaxID=6687 RepID=UPI0018A75115|nr:uncharacterized protein LOC119572095 [Penaeus monodon]